MNARPRTSKSAAFTLIEVVITLAISSLFLIALVGSYRGYVRAFASQESADDTAIAADSIMSALDGAARQSDRVAASHAFGAATYTSGANAVVFELPSIDASGQIISGTYDYIGIYASGTAAYAAFDAGSGSARRAFPPRLASNLSALSFSYDNANPAVATKIDAYATTSETAGGRSVSFSLHRQIFLRNQ